ncbi:MAG: hypothetical protein AB7W16_10915 [Candidatus Obscuribacterales bacterium]
MLRSSPDKSIYAIPIWVVVLTLAVFCMRIYLRIVDESALQSGASGIVWNNPSTLQSLSLSSDKLVLYYLKLPNCQVCKSFEKRVLTNREAVDMINESFYPVCIELNVYSPGNKYNPMEMNRDRGVYKVPMLVVKTVDERLIEFSTFGDSTDSLVDFLEKAKFEALEENAFIAIGEGDYDTASDAFRKSRKSSFFTLYNYNSFLGHWHVLKATGDNVGADALVKEAFATERANQVNEKFQLRYRSISPALADYLLGRTDEKTVLSKADGLSSEMTHMAISLNKLLDGKIDESIEHLNQADAGYMVDSLKSYLKSRQLGQSFYVNGVLRRY